MLLLSAAMTQQSYATTKSCNCVAFRLDDIQDYYLNNAQTEIINVFHKKNASLTIGVIGNYFGNDTRLVSYIKEKINNSNNVEGRIEIANHGWNHEDFTTFDMAEQSLLIKRTNEKISSLLGVTPTVLITPFNTINNDTLIAMRENQIHYVSANVTSDPPPYQLQNETLYHFPITAMTGNLNHDNTYWNEFNYKETYAQILGSLLNYGFAVVMMHPQEYTKREALNFQNNVDGRQIHELEFLIDKIQNDRFEIVTVSEIPKHATAYQKSPEWIKNIFIWHEKGKISEDEVLNAIKFLTAKGIIKFGL